MNQTTGEVKDTIKGFFFAYAVKRNVTDTLSYLSEDIRWIGSGAVPVTQGKKQVMQVLEAEFAGDQIPYNLEYTIEEVRSCAADVAEGFFEIHLHKTMANSEEVSLTVQLSAVCRLEGFLYKICTLHTTGVDDLEEEKSLHTAKTAETIFSEYEQHFQEMSMDFFQKSIPGGIIGCYLEPGFPLYFINDQMLDYLGYTREELVFEMEGYMARCVHPDDAAFVALSIERKLKEREEYQIRYRMLKKNKDAIWVMERGRKAVNDVGRLVVIRVLFDITETVLLQQETQEQAGSLCAANQEMEDLYHTVNRGVVKVAWDESLTILHANPMFYQLLGYTRQELEETVGQKAASLVHPDDWEKLQGDLSEMKPETGHRLLRRLRMRTAQDQWMWMQIEATLSPKQGEEPPVFYCTCTDIRNLRIKELEQKRQDYFMSLIAADMVGGMLVTGYDEERTVVYVGDGLPDSLGYSMAEWQGVTDHSFARVLSEDDQKDAWGSIQRQLEQGTEYELEYRVKNKKETLQWMKEKGRWTTSDEGEPLLICVLMDITKQKQDQQQSLHATRVDPLTRLLNQDYVKQGIRTYLEEKPREQGVGICMLDLDNFKQINDVYGHLEGDRILIGVATVLNNLFTRDELVGRIDGDKFVVLLEPLRSKEEAKEKAELICNRICETFDHYFSTGRITASVGVAVDFSKEMIPVKELYDMADEALYQAKFSGKNQCCVVDKQSAEGLTGENGYQERPGYTSVKKQVLMEGEEQTVYFNTDKKIQCATRFLAAVGMAGMGAGICWVLYDKSTSSGILFGAILGGLGCLILILGITMAKWHGKLKKRVAGLMEQCQCLVKDVETMGRKGSPDESLEVLEEALHTYQAKMEEATCMDPLLKIGNRAKAGKDIEQLIQCKEVSQISLFLLDIQEFSKYNDVFSIRTGDEIIKGVRHRLAKCFGEQLYRVDGDVFLGVLAENANDHLTLEHIQKELETPICTSNVEIKVRYNLGICHYPGHGKTATELLERAQSALNYAKKQPKVNAVIYNESITGILRREREILSLLRKRIAQDLLEVWYQPIYDMEMKQFTTAEALLRLRDDKGGFIEPYSAILVAEKNDAIGEIGEYVLRTACQTMKQLETEGSTIANIHVNLSVQQVAQPNFAQHTLHLIDQAGARPSQIGVEVTETMLMQSFDTAVESLLELRNAGTQIALDDFGSGYSSLNYLARLPIDRLKLDRQLVLQVNEGEEQREFIRTIVQMAKIKNMKVVAEGVEDPAMLEKIMSCGADYIQGYYFSKPLPKEEFFAFMRQQVETAGEGTGSLNNGK